MTTEVKEELEFHQQAYQDHIVNPCPEALEDMKEFFPDLSESKPDFWEYVSYGLAYPLSMQFLDCYEHVLDWQIISKYAGFEVGMYFVAGNSIRCSLADQTHPAPDFEKNVNFDLVVITEWILLMFEETPRHLFKTIGLDVSFRGRDLLALAPEEMTSLEKRTMYYLQKRAIKGSYKTLDNTLAQSHPETPAKNRLHVFGQERMRGTIKHNTQKLVQKTGKKKKKRKRKKRKRKNNKRP